MIGVSPSARDKEGSHLATADEVVGTEPVIDWRVAALGDAGRSQSVDGQLKDRIVVIDK